MHLPTANHFAQFCIRSVGLLFKMVENGSISQKKVNAISSSVFWYNLELFFTFLLWMETKVIIISFIEDVNYSII